MEANVSLVIIYKEETIVVSERFETVEDAAAYLHDKSVTGQLYNAIKVEIEIDD